MNNIAKYYPYALSLFILICINKIFDNIIDSIDFSELMSSTMVVFSVLFGFLLTVSTLLYTIDTKTMRELRKTNGYKSLVQYLKVAIYASLSIAVVSLCFPLFKNSEIFKIQFEILFYLKNIYLYLVFLSLIFSIRFIYVFINIVE